MTSLSFDSHNFETVSDALDIAEDMTANFFKLSSRQWGRCRYEVKTRSSQGAHEITDGAFALLNKGETVAGGSGSSTSRRECYFICLQDPQILEALGRDRNLNLLPLLVYIFTHELIHIVRFSNFVQRFKLDPPRRDREEMIVHSTTFEILADLAMPRLDYVLDSYKDHRTWH